MPKIVTQRLFRWICSLSWLTALTLSLVTSAEPNDEEFVAGWNNGTRYKTGPAYNKLGQEPADSTRAMIEYFKDLAYAGILNQQGYRTIDKRPPSPGLNRFGEYTENEVVNGRIFFALFEGDAPNAFAAKLENAGTVHTDREDALTPHATFNKIFGPIAEKTWRGYVVGIVDEFLKMNLTEGELAFAIGHEIGHIQNGDTEEGGGQRAELGADKRGLQAIVGRYPLTAAFSLWHKMHAWETAQKTNGRRKHFGESFLSSHPDSGVRYTALQKEVEDLRAAGKDTAKSDRPLAIDLSKLNSNSGHFILRDGIHDPQVLEQFFTLVLDDKFLNRSVTEQEARIDFGVGMRINDVWRWTGDYAAKLSAANLDYLISKWIEQAEIRADWTSAEKVNQFWKILSLLYLSRNTLWKEENSALQQKIVEFLVKHTGDRADQFNANTFRSPFTSSQKAYGAPLQDFIHLFWLNGKNASAKASVLLTQVRPQWHAVFARNIATSFGTLLQLLSKYTSEERPISIPFALALPGFLTAQNARMLGEASTSTDIEDLIGVVSVEMSLVRLLKDLNSPAWTSLQPRHNVDTLAMRLASVHKPLSIHMWISVLKIHSQMPFSPAQLEAIMTMFARQIHTLVNVNLAQIHDNRRKLYSTPKAILNFMDALAASGKIKSFDLVRFLDVVTPEHSSWQGDLTEFGGFLSRASAREIWDGIGRTSKAEEQLLQDLMLKQLAGSTRLEGVERDQLITGTMRIQNRLAFLGTRLHLDKKTLEAFSFADLQSLMTELRSHNAAYKACLSREMSLTSASAEFVLRLIDHHFSRYPSADAWLEDVLTISEKVDGISTEWSTVPPENREAYSRSLREKIESSDITVLKKFMSSESASYLLNDEDLGEVLGRYIHLSSHQTPNPADAVKKLLQEVDEKQSFSQKRQRAWSYAQSRAAELNQAQPSEVANYQAFVSPTSINGTDVIVRLTSQVSAQIRAMAHPDLLLSLDYLMGHGDQLPQMQESFRKAMIDLRGGLKGAEIGIRVLAANILLTGPDGIVFKKDGLAALTKQILSPLPEGPRREFGRATMQSLVEIEDLNRSFAFALIKAQSADLMRGKSPERAFLRAFVMATGVPGGKLAQYLGFTNLFAEYSDAFSEFQDQPFPVSYIQMLREAEDAAGAAWLKTNRILGVAGYGTVNIAVYYSPKDKPNEVRVLKFLRKNVETKTDLDFSRIGRLVEILVRDYPGNGEYQTIQGLLPLIQRSLRKEFSQEHVLRINALTSVIYNTSRRGIHLRALPVDGAISPRAVDMAKAEGTIAKKLRTSDFNTYKQYMAAFLELERDVLLGLVRTPDGQSIVNPDIHDGQVLFDLQHQRINLIDMSQSSIISDFERTQAIALLKVISNLLSLENSQAMLREYFSVEISTVVLKKILSSSRRMDSFIHLLAAIENHGRPVPTATADWVMAFDRWLSLGKTIGWNEAELAMPFFAAKSSVEGPKTGAARGKHTTTIVGGSSCASALRASNKSATR